MHAYKGRRNDCLANSLLFLTKIDVAHQSFVELSVNLGNCSAVSGAASILHKGRHFLKGLVRLCNHVSCRPSRLTCQVLVAILVPGLVPLFC